MFFGSLSYKTKQFFLVLIKLSIVVGAFYFIYQKLTTNDALDFNAFMHFLNTTNAFSAKTILFLLLLSCLNWFLETLKWKHLISSFKPISFKNALEQSLGSLTASLFTPNRIGEYGAKAMYYNTPNRKKIVLLNLLNNVMQMGTTTVFGCVGLLILNAKHHLPLHYDTLIKIVIVSIVILAFTVFGAKTHKFNIRGYTLGHLIKYYKGISTKILSLAFVLSVARYLVFSFQLFWLLKTFGANLSYINAMVVITSMYLLASIIPTIFIFDIVVKSSVAVFLFSIVGVNDFTTLSIMTLMWILNIVLPSVFGSYYVLNFNLPKNN